MRFSEYLSTLSPDDQRTLPVELTLGYGRLQLAERLHRQGPPSGSMLGMLGAAYAALRGAQAVLDRDAPAEDAPAPATPPDALPPSWDALVGGDNHRQVVEALLQMATEMARDAVAAVREDAEVDVVRGLVRDALSMLADARDDALGTT